jgi:hypothetical protein
MVRSNWCVIAKAAGTRPWREIERSDMAADYQGVDIALCDGLFQAILRNNLRDEIILVFEQR